MRLFSSQLRRSASAKLPARSDMDSMLPFVRQDCRRQDFVRSHCHPLSFCVCPFSFFRSSGWGQGGCGFHFNARRALTRLAAASASGVLWAISDPFVLRPFLALFRRFFSLRVTGIRNSMIVWTVRPCFSFGPSWASPGFRLLAQATRLFGRGAFDPSGAPPLTLG